MAKVRMLKSTANHKLEKEANVILKRGRKPLTAEEKNPEARFIRVAGMRFTKAVKLIKALRHCADRNTYSYTDAQIDKIFTTLEKTIARTKEVYEAAKHPSSNGVVRKVNKLENLLA